MISIFSTHLQHYLHNAGGGILQHHLPGGRQGNGGEVAAAGREANDQVTEGHDRKGSQIFFLDSRILNV